MLRASAKAIGDRRLQPGPRIFWQPDGSGQHNDLACDLALRSDLPGTYRQGRGWRVGLIKLNRALHGTEDSLAEEAG